jgi:hypothetical protein
MLNVFSNRSSVEGFDAEKHQKIKDSDMDITQPFNKKNASSVLIIRVFLNKYLIKLTVGCNV